MGRILIGVLGYGSRMPDPGVMAALADHPVIAGVLVFWNAPDEGVRIRLASIEAASNRISIRTSPENLGSAGGYRRLLEWAASRPDWDQFLLLDDDLVPQPGCVERLAEAAASEHGDGVIHLAYRRDLPELAALVESRKPLARTRPGACLGFHVANLFSGRPSFSSHFDDEGITLDTAPYGGLLVPRSALARLGVPMESLFLYADDTELTLRFTRGGGKIRLLIDAVVTDRSASWNATPSKGGNLARRVLNLDDTKAYFEARNRNYLARRFHSGSPWVYAVNRAVFLTAVYVLATAHGRLGRARLIHRAIRDGEVMAAAP
ncbi:MAG TPA: glycosyltransferase [Lysobacter sp.]|nr:glycosyltransferase [Lysobacter sp.]